MILTYKKTALCAIITEKKRGDIMLELVLGKDWTKNTAHILSMIADDVHKRRSGRILLVPELISHDMERRLCMAAGDTASRYAEVLTFTRLVRRVAEDSGCAIQECLDQGGRVVAMAAAARQLHSKLKVYASLETKPEFLTQLLDAVDEFKRCCITAEDLRTASRLSEGVLAQKLEELSLLLEAYDALCQRGKRDPRDQMNWVLEQLEEIDFAENNVFYIDGFPDLTRQHMAIVEHLIQVSPAVTVGLNCDQPDSHALAFEKAAQTASELILCAKKHGIPYEIVLIPERKDALAAVRGSLFQGTILHKVNQLRVLRANSIHSEVQAAAEYVLKLVQNGCRYRDISIVCADMASYQHVVDMVFGRCGIPVYRSGTEDILRSTVITTVLSALDAALGGFEQRDVLRYLKSSVSGLDADTCDQLENYAVLWSIWGNRWNNAWTNHPDGINESWSDNARKQLEYLNSAREAALQPLFLLSKEFNEAANVSEQVNAICAFLDRIRDDEVLLYEA